MKSPQRLTQLAGQNMSSPYLAIDSRVAMRTGALVRPIAVKTSASIEARFGVTLIDIILAVAASESR